MTRWYRFSINAVGPVRCRGKPACREIGSSYRAGGPTHYLVCVGLLAAASFIHEVSEMDRPSNEHISESDLHAVTLDSLIGAVSDLSERVAELERREPDYWIVDRPTICRAFLISRTASYRHIAETWWPRHIQGRPGCYRSDDVDRAMAHTTTKTRSKSWQSVGAEPGPLSQSVPSLTSHRNDN